MTHLDADQIARMRLMSGRALYDYALRLVDEVVRVRATLEQTQAENERLRAMIPTDAWFGAWQCGCSDTERTPLGIPEFCPVHGRKLVSNAAGSTRVQLNHAGVSGYGFHPGPAGADRQEQP